MTKYREILRLHSLKLSQRNIALSCSVSKTTVNRVLKQATVLNLSWPLDDQQTESVLAELLFPTASKDNSEKRLPNFDYIRNELLKMVSVKSCSGLNIWKNVGSIAKRLSCTHSSVGTSS